MVVINEIREEEEDEETVSSSRILNNEYEVFLSFRGEDTRFGFTDHLHKALVEADINTFLDDDCIQTGDDLKPELERAIKQSRSFVVVLSKNYAYSTWCLNELVLILEQRRKFGMIVMPIFYHVDPSHVRKQEDSFAEALKKHEKGIEEETDPEKKQQRIHRLQLWRDALKEVSDLKGKDVKGWHETRFIQQIVTEINHRLESGIPNLVNKCLLTIHRFDNHINMRYVNMHQLLQDMGRHIVHQESLPKPWKRSILCCHKEAFNVLKENQGTEKTRGLLLDKKILEKKLSGVTNGKENYYEDDQHLKNSRFIYIFWWLFGWLVLLFSKFHPEDDEEEGNLKTKSFTKMKNLELLQLNFVKLTGSYEKFPKRLRWLCWHGFPSQYIPPDIPVTKLVVLDISHSNLKGLWKVPKLLTSLKILDLRNSFELIRTGDLSGIPNLERLILAGCANLVEISESIGKLRELVLLDLSYCVKLPNLPRNMSKLRKMTTLSLDGCCNLFKTLVVPQIQQSSWLLLPCSILKLNLSRNNLYNESFPVDFSSLSSLKYLDISFNPIDSLPNCVRSLSGIETLDIRGCEKLKSAIDLPSSIRDLYLAGSGSLERITFHSASSKQVSIDTRRCYKLREAQFLFELEKDGKEITNNFRYFRWPSLGYLEQQQVMMYEGRIFSTHIPVNKVPHWCTYKTNSSSISFTVPPSPNNKRIRGSKMFFPKTVTWGYSEQL